MNILSLLIICICSITVSPLAAADYYVNREHGNDRNGDGSAHAPYRSVRKGTSVLAPGDTLHIMPSPKVIPEAIIMTNIKGTAEKPIVIDGMMNTFSGADALRAKDWKNAAPGLYICKRKLAGAMVRRFFLQAPGKMIRMGQKSKAATAPLKKPEELQDYEWTFTAPDSLYLKLPTGITPEKSGLVTPVRINGIQVAGNSENLEFRNILVRNFLNDGLNIHGNCRNIVFINTAAINCGDDGASSHNQCKVAIKNFVSTGNATGICHLGDTSVTHSDLYIENIDSRDILMLNRKNIFKNVYIDSKANARCEFRISASPKVRKSMSVKNVRNEFENCVFSNISRPLIKFEGELKISGLNIYGYHLAGNIPAGVIVKKSRPAEKLSQARKNIFTVFGNKIEKEISR